MIVVPFDDEHTAQQHADTYEGRVTWNQYDLWWSIPLELSIHDIHAQMLMMVEGERMRARAKHPSGRTS